MNTSISCALCATLLAACAATARTPAASQALHASQPQQQAVQAAVTTARGQAATASQSPQSGAGVPSPTVAPAPTAVPAPAAAPPPQFTLETSAADSVPQTTVVPVVQPPVGIVEHTVVYEDAPENLSRTERRAWRAERYAAKIDSIVQSRNYLFFPNSMQEIPGGMIRSIYAGYFFFGMFVDHVEVHLPTERGLTQYIEMLNFESMSLHDYRSARVQWGWSISFDIADGEAVYHADFAVSTVTGETVLTLFTPQVTMRYIGWLWNKRVNDPRYHRLD